MKNWRSTLVAPTDSILKALEAIDRSALQIALVADERQRLLGVMTDGDIRGHILAHTNLDTPVLRVMNTQPMTASIGEDRQQLLARMRARQIHQLPLLDGEGRVAGLATLDEMLTVRVQPNLVVLMAGGKGTRLRPLTENCPKPMLRVGSRPILETIIQQFQDHGFQRFVISVNYMAETITSHFGDGSRFGAEIAYLHEGRPMGTAGALSLLSERPTEPFFVMNGDLLTKLNFASLLAFHQERAAPLTLCVREHAVSVPFGVAEVERDHLVRLEEKPTYRKMVNAGIYVCDPDVLDLLSKGQPTSMVAIAQTLLERGDRPAVFPVHEYWVDIGQHGDFAQALADYESVFG